MNNYVRLTGAKSGRPLYIDCDYIVSVVACEGGSTMVCLRVRGDEAFYVRESPEEVAQGITDAYFPRPIHPAGFNSTEGVTP